MYDYHIQTTYEFINRLLVEGENLTVETACVIGRAVADHIDISDASVLDRNIADALGIINDKLGFDVLTAQTKTSNYVANRIHIASRPISPLSEAGAKWWALGGTTYISEKEHEMWQDVKNQYLYNEFRKLLNGGS